MIIVVLPLPLLLGLLLIVEGIAGGERVAVSKVQVGLLGSARQLQRDLERMTRKANTNSPEGLHYLLQGESCNLQPWHTYCTTGHDVKGLVVVAS